ncbi:MAG: alpha/beta hydrolase [Firmicutes bacterium]|nr:alpha/beta hydrolase [Bacillota bacterium]MBQ2233494.1 alpha/beta hydrolase [Erysipelotrichaceae bacterium]MBR3392896.1 alpha/beta hydrolase [Bacillota bacterium]
MIHKKIKIRTKGSSDNAYLVTYFLESSDEIPAPPRPCVVLCPGGGYAFTSDREAEPVAMRFLAQGIHVVILRYSVAPAVFPTALLELGLAVKYVRSVAYENFIDPDRIVTMGFSAGGHLVASYGNFWRTKQVAELLGLFPQDLTSSSVTAMSRTEREAFSEVLRPNAQILGYPVITSGRFAHRGSFDNLLGESATEVQLERLSLENTVNENTPATFIWHTQADDAVPVENSLLFVNALQEAHIKTEFHLFPNGPHGLSLADNTTSVSARLIDPNVAVWIDMAVRFVKNL